jgi:hypothetical protein
MLLHYDSLGYSNWVTSVKRNLYRNGFGYIWEAQSVENSVLFLHQYSQRLKDQYMQQWSEECKQNLKLTSYCLFKTYFKFERYLEIIDIKKVRFYFSSFRTSSHSLLIEKGRHIGLAREQRTCFYCNDQIENEYHFTLVCPFYKLLRERYIDKK